MLVVVAAVQLPAIGAGAILYPGRHRTIATAPQSCESTAFSGEGVTLRGWRCAARLERRGTLVYLHGIADNRSGSVGIVDRFTARGFDVIAYDSRAHGESGGDACTYGYFEKLDLRRVIDTAAPGPIVLIGTSLGAAVALQEAAVDDRVTAVVAAEAFSDLRTVAIERAPFVFRFGFVEPSFRRAEAAGHFQIDAVSPLRAAASIKAPTLLVHGAADTETPPDHSRRIFGALSGAKRLSIVPGAGHNESLRGSAWSEIDSWIEASMTAGMPSSKVSSNACRARTPMAS